MRFRTKIGLATSIMFTAVMLSGCATLFGPPPSDFAQIREGWTAAQVREAVGSPSHINTSRVAGRERQQWVYRTWGMSGQGRAYVYLERGGSGLRVTAIQY